MDILKIQLKYRFLHIVILSGIFFVSCMSPLFAQNYKTVKAKSGDGIYSLLKRNGISPSELKTFVELNKDKLGKDNQLIIGQLYKLPPVVQVTEDEVVQKTTQKQEITDHSLFGEKYRKVQIVDHALDGAFYYLISGHGGPDPGAIGRLEGNMLCEDEYAYDVTLRLARNLTSHGASVYMIIQDKNDGIRDERFLAPDHDELCFPGKAIPEKQLPRLKQRTETVNSLYKQHRSAFQRQVVIHVDSRRKGENIDVFFYYDERSNTGKKMATNLMQTFYEKYRQHQPGRSYEGSISSRDLFVIKNSFPPAVFIELGNINHQRDQKRLIISDNRQALANWLTEGLIRDFNNNK